MRILSLIAFILIFTDVTWSDEPQNTACQDGGTECSNEEDDSVLSEKSYGVQEVNHDRSIEAIVMKPPAQGINNALAHFRQQWNEIEEDGGEEEEEEEDYEKVDPDNIGPLLKGISEFNEPHDGNENDNDDDDDSSEHNYDTAGPNANGLPPIDPNDPEEVEKNKQMEGEQLFSKILSINNELHITGVFEGDMRFTRTRNAAGDSDIWPKSRFGVLKGLVPIPYKIATTYNKTEVDIIKSAMALYTKHTCIRFIPRKTEISYIYITDAKGCWAYVGKTGYSAQTVSLGRPGCVVKGIAAHEMMHVVGFQHEHSRSDRDKYVTVLEHNIQKDMKPNFEVHKNTKNLVIYDYNSVMHYSKNAFSKFQYLPAIQISPKRKPEPEIGQRERMSPYDIEEIKYLYNCAEGTYQRCGKDFINSRGDSFSSPRHPNPYPPEAHCTWKITVPRGLYVSLTITKLDIKASKFCQKDAILIHDGADASSPQLKVLCEKKKEATTILSTGNSLFVMFTSDPSDQGSSTGFQASFKISHSPGVRPQPLAVPTLPPIRNPENSFNCDFDSGTCGMTQDTFDEIDWIRYKGATPSQGTGPTGDHTSGNGYYMYVESSLPSKLGDNAILRTPWMNRAGVSCISFSYHMLGAYTGTLRLYAFEKRNSDRNGHEVLLWERHGNQGNQWISESVTYRPKANVEHVQYFWEAFVFFYLSDFGLDDVSVKNENCNSSPRGPTTTTQRVVVINPTRTITTVSKRPFVRPSTVAVATTKSIATTVPNVVTSPVSAVPCDFESGLCGWTQEKTDDYDWIRSNQETPSHNTGPRTDHTTTKGYFLFIEASSPRIQGDVARLLSPRLTPKPHCLQMWYHMYGTQMGTLMIKQITDGVETKLIEKSGNKGDQWYYLELDIITPSVKTSGKARLTSEMFTHIAIDAVRGAGYPGDLAIDDVVVTSSACASKSVPSTSAPSQLRGVQCDFDTKNDLCGFFNSESDNFDWTPNKESTQSGSTGPTVDHTKGDSSGYYMYIEASSPRTKGNNATLISPKLASGRYCVKFYAHMWGSGMGDVQVYTSEVVNSKSESRQNRWEMSGTQGDSWLEGEFEFETAVNIDYVQVEFVGIIGHTFTSDAALDDISITPGWCRSSEAGGSKSSVAPQTTPKSTTRERFTRPTTTKKSTTTTPTTTPTKTTRAKRLPTTAKATTRARPLSVRPTSRPTTRRPSPRVTKSTAKTRMATATTTTTTTTREPRKTVPRKVTAQRPRPPSRRTTTTATPKTTSPEIGVGRHKVPTTQSQVTQATPISRLKEFSCDFESEKYCDMSQLNEDKIDWIRHSGSTPTSGTGPLKDHTRSTNDGHYLFIEGSDPRVFRDNAIIATPALSAEPAERCLTFWYHMYGKGTGSLKVYSELSRNGVYKKFAIKSNKQLVFSENGEKGNTWRMARVTVKATSRNSAASLRFHFEGVRGRSYRSDAAIDDICITSSPCNVQSRCVELSNADATTTVAPSLKNLVASKPGRPAIVGRPRAIAINRRTARSTTRAPKTTTTATTTTTTTSKPTTAPVDSPIVNGLHVTMPYCTFDATGVKKSFKPGPDRVSARQQAPSSDVLCGWLQDKRDKFDWTWKSGKTPSSYTGPNGDHTTGKGHYLFIESSAPRVINDVAILRSKKMYPTQYCVEIYYNMYGSGIGQLLVRAYQEIANTPKLVSNLRAIKGQQGKQGQQVQQAWGHLQLNYRPRRGVTNVEFRIEGAIGNNYMGDLAIDDVQITPGRCESCLRPNKIFKDRFGQVKVFSTGCVHSTLLYVKCCSLAEEKIMFQSVPKCSPNALDLERLNWMCSYM